MPEDGGHGVIVAQGGAFAGWALYLIDGNLKYCHNLAGLARYVTTSTEPVPAGTHQVRMEFTYDGGGLAKGGDVALFVDGAKVGEGRADATVPMRLLRRRDLRRRPGHRFCRERRVHARGAAASPARSTGSSSTSTRRPRTSTTSSAPRSACGWP